MKEVVFISEDNICLFIFAVFGVAATIIGIYYLGVAYSTWILRLKTTVEPEVLYRGDMAKVFININPQKTVNVSQIIVKLECRRYFITRDSRGREHREEDVMALGEVYIEGDSFSCGERTITADIMVPTDGLPTTILGGGNLYIKWFITTTLEIPSFFSARNKKEIQIFDVSFRKPIGTSKETELYPILPEAKEVKICSACGVENNVKDKFCTDCGAILD